MLPFLLSVNLIILTFFPGASAQIDNSDVLSVQAFLSVDKIRPGDEFKIAIKTTLHDDWHINSNKPSDEFLIPTVVSFDGLDGIVLAEINYPEGKQKTFAFSETPLSVYEGEILIWVNARAMEKINPGEIKITGEFSYQACNDLKCLIPTSEPFEISTAVVAAETPVNVINEDKFKQTFDELGKLQGERSTSANEIGQLISGSGLFLTLFFIFVGGLALNLTPCVYPIIPITISFFVGQASGKASKSLFLALVYVLGMSLTYSVLGVTAAMTGGLLGSSLQNPLILVAIAGVFLIFAASMFGAFEIKVPNFLNKIAGGSRQGIFGSLFMGLTVGIVAAPCIGPFVLSLLTYVAAQGDPFMGFLLFFILSLGLGLPYLFLGTFSGSIRNLPRSGEWMVWVKKVFGVIMIAVAVYFISSLLPEIVYIALMTATVISGGLLVGFIDKSTASFVWFKGLKKGIGTVMILFGAWLSLSTWSEAKAAHIDWQTYDDSLVSQAKSTGTPILIDFYAAWCIPCKKIDKKLFSSPGIVDESRKFMSLKADLTKENSDQVRNLRKKYNVRGVPTIILIDGTGREYKRFTDELVKMDPDEFIEIMHGAFVANGQ